MGAHLWTQQNISTGGKYFTRWGPQSLYFFICFLPFLALLHQFQHPNAGCGQPATAPHSKSPAEPQASVQSLRGKQVWKQKPASARAQPLRGDGAAPGSISRCAACPWEPKLGPVKVRGPFSHRLPRGRLPSPRTYHLLQSRLPRQHLPGAKTKYSGSPKRHN